MNSTDERQEHREQRYARLTDSGEAMRMGAQSDLTRSLRVGGARASNQVRTGATLGRVLRPGYILPGTPTGLLWHSQTFYQNDLALVQTWEATNEYAGRDPQRSVLGFAWLATMFVELLMPQPDGMDSSTHTGGPGPVGTDSGFVTCQAVARLSLLNKAGDEIKWATLSGIANDTQLMVTTDPGHDNPLDYVLDINGYGTPDPIFYDDEGEDGVPIPEFWSLKCDFTGTSHTESGGLPPGVLFQVRFTWLEAQQP